LANGAIQITSSSGLAPFVYNWTGPNGFTSTTRDITGLKAGQYHLLITDSNYCTASETINLTEPGSLGMTFTLSASIAGGYNINCAGDSTGYIGIEPLNQVKTVEYLWDDGVTGKTRTNLPAGDFSVIITDENNCHATSTVTLTQPDSLKMALDFSQPFCPDKPDGEIRLEVTGGVRGADYSYKWSDNSTGRDLSNIPKGLYKVIVKDMNGCTIRDSVYVESLNETCLIIPNAISPNGDLINDVWNIGLKELYPAMEIMIFNRWGETLWRSEKGYPQPWDGKSNGSPLPIDSYHYIIDLHNGSKPLIGNVTVVK
jgi:gliding motility-associated-like protein